MDFPCELKVTVPHIFKDEISITLNPGLTTLVGANASGKTQTLKALRRKLDEKFDAQRPPKVRYLSSNRLALIEEFRSRATQYPRNERNLTLGDSESKLIRRELEVAAGDFLTMDERRDVFIKVAERLSIFFERKIDIRWHNGQLQVFFGRKGSDDEYSVAAEASGLINLISILAALYDDEIEALLIDEPEVSLHPQLQSYLLHEMKRAAKEYKKSIVIATHSVEMIDLARWNDLPNFIFFGNDAHPVQISSRSDILKKRKLQDFILRMGLIYREGFFAKKILLIEGASDLFLCRYLSSRFHFSLAAAGTQVIPVDGKGQFPIIAQFFSLIGKSVCALADLDAFTDDSVMDLLDKLLETQQTEANRIASSHGWRSVKDTVRECKSDLTKQLKADEVSLKTYCESKKHPYWVHASEKNNTALLRASTALLFTVTDNELSTWSNTEIWRGLRDRLTAIFDALEKLGIFILRKGAIESYYCSAPQTTFDGKPSVAVEEITGIDSDKMRYTDDMIRERYDDVIRAIRFAASAKTVDESGAVKEKLLDELPSMQLQLKQGVSGDEILWRNHTKNKGKSIFDYGISTGNKIRVDLRSKIMDVEGFPFEIGSEENAVSIVDEKISNKQSEP